MAPPYSRIRLICIHFGDVEDECFRDELQSVANELKSRFNFIVEVWQIPIGEYDATSLVSEKLDRFKKQTHDDAELLIVMYGGHGVTSSSLGFRSVQPTLVWASVANGKITQIVYWNRIQDNTVFPGEKDTLVLLDCCHAGAAQRSQYTARKDILAACPWDQVTPMRSAPQSFTSRFLRAVCGFQQPFTVDDLYKAIARQAPAQPPVYESLPPNPTHDIVLSPVASPQILSSRLATNRQRDVPSAQSYASDAAQTPARSSAAQFSTPATQDSSVREAEIINACLRAGYSSDQLRAGIALRMQHGMSKAQAFENVAEKLGSTGRSAQASRDEDESDEEDEDESEDEESEDAEYSD